MSPATLYSLCGEAICGKPQQIQGKVRNVGKGLRESYIFPFVVLRGRKGNVSRVHADPGVQWLLSCTLETPGCTGDPEVL